MGTLLGFFKSGGGLYMNIKQRKQKIDIFNLAMGDNTFMGDWMAKYVRYWSDTHFELKIIHDLGSQKAQNIGCPGEFET